ncbi:MAG: ATP phosphoribosyltransferase regulatory subunit, partial [Clostridia bacterium]|nr:ATP phosphoribosyltransferase regulatory subunit [Clostridia bacterium]
MSVDENILKSEEKAVFSLRKLYLVHGYTHYKMNKFEEYDLYSENKDFLASDGIITFTDPDGKLLALKPDVTLSVLKNFRDVKDSVQKLYYNESVYRISENSHTYKEIMQTGLECLGDLTEREIAEVVLLALKSLSLISPRFMLNLSHVGLLAAVLDECGLTGKTRQTVLEAVTRKNRGRLKELCSPEQFDRLKVLI